MSNPLLKINDLNLTIDKKVILDSLTLDVNKGDFVVLLGANGSGKSTLLKLINRTYRRTGGEIYLQDKKLDCYSHAKYSQKVVTICQATQDNLFYGLTVFENAKLYLSAITKAELCEYLHAFNPKLVAHVDLPVEVLSGGEQQVLVLALCLKLEPTLLLLDEHTSGLDPRTAEQIMHLTSTMVKQYGVTCIMTTHNLNHALEVGNRLIAINSGKLTHQFSAEEKMNLQYSKLLNLYYRSSSNVEIMDANTTIYPQVNYAQQ